MTRRAHHAHHAKAHHPRKVHAKAVHVRKPHPVKPHAPHHAKTVMRAAKPAKAVKKVVQHTTVVHGEHIGHGKSI